MKRTCLLACTVALVTLCSCTVKEQRLGYDDATGGVVLTALTDMPGVRTGVVDGGTEVFWESQEEIKVFAGTSSAKFVSANTDLASKADFIGPSDFSVAPGKPVVAVYPYSDDVAYDGECITMTLPSEQVACPGTFARGTNIAVAKSDTHTLQFRNVCGGLRFSVKEEGIKKVIFEGLGGEIISGKITVAFEDGLPVVRSVSNGSPFITLQAPEGQTLEVGKWYYIVALPGALDKGYKLRFYKEDTYAKRLSEQSVSIKRSTFGSVAEADKGMEYESTQGHFPITLEEIKVAEEEINKLSSTIFTIVDEMTNGCDNKTEIEDVAKGIANIEGVISTEISEEKDVIYVVQKDSVCFNVFGSKLINSDAQTKHNSEVASTRGESATISSLPSLSVANNPSANKALLLCPKKPESDDIEYEHISDYLGKIGFFLEYKKDQYASIDWYDPDKLREYGVVFMIGHGMKFKTADKKIEEKTAIMTGSKVGSMETGNLKDYCIGVDVGKDSGYYYVGKTWFEAQAPEAGEHFFDNTIFFVLSCFGYRFDDMANYFLSHGAAAYCGYTHKMQINANLWSSTTNARRCLNVIVESLCAGTSVERACYRVNIECPLSSILGNYKSSPENNGPVYLYDPAAYNLKEIINGSKVTLMWDNPASTGYYERSVYLDGKWYAPDTGRGVTVSITNGNEHSWYVQSDLYINGSLYGSYRSVEKTFTIEGSEPVMNGEVIDLGLSVDWCTCNLGAASPENFGGYWAWGETDTKTEYSWSTYKYCNGTEKTLTKYVDDSSYGYNGFVDNKGILESEDDAATKNLGSKFHTPTCAEWCELLENTTHTWTNNFNGTGVSGYIMMSTVPGYTGKYIFLPAAGYQWYTNVGVGRYMTSEQQNTLPSGFDTAYLAPNEIYAAGYDRKCSTGSREEGHSIRPVFGDVVSQPTISISPSSLNFGEVVVGSSKGNEAGRVTMTNTGSSNLVISSFDCPSGFSHSPNLALPHTIAPGDSWTVTFAFRPTSAKQYSGYISINSNASNGSVKQVKVSGTGI